MDTSVKSSQDDEKRSVERKPNLITYYQSTVDWIRHALDWKQTDQSAEKKILSHLEFYPERDSTRKAEIIDTEISGGNHIHEFYIENTAQPMARADGKKEEPLSIVMLHGYAASLVLFLNNFSLFSKVPGIRIHAIDMLGFGLSSRPKFPRFPAKTVKEVEDVEGFFIDSIEEWRIKRNINRFVLVGHSLGGYLACAYALKYNRKMEATGESLISKLILVSPAGVERNKFSLLKNNSEPDVISDLERQLENTENPQVDVAKEVTLDQEDIVTGERIPETEDPASRSERFVRFLWQNNFSPFSVVRSLGPLRSKLISRWTLRRFSEIYGESPEKFEDMHNYFYRICNAKGSGEFAITRLFHPFVLAKLPLLDRCPGAFVPMNLPSLWIYGDHDWMNRDAGKEIVDEINELSKKDSIPSLAKFSIVNEAGHHVYLDNPKTFNDVVFSFIGEQPRLQN